MGTVEDSITGTFQAYRNALIKSDVTACAACYADSGVVMAQGFQSQVGITAVKKWYELCFSLISLDVVFDIEEVVVTSDTFAFARTSSAGSQTRLASGEKSQEANQELFVLERVGSAWKIARYCFSSTKAVA